MLGRTGMTVIIAASLIILCLVVVLTMRCAVASGGPSIAVAASVMVLTFDVITSSDAAGPTAAGSAADAIGTLCSRCSPIAVAVPPTVI